MRYPASEKLEIIRFVEQSAIGIRQTNIGQSGHCQDDLLQMV